MLLCILLIVSVSFMHSRSDMYEQKTLLSSVKSDHTTCFFFSFIFYIFQEFQASLLSIYTRVSQNKVL